jgi:hypothetical protein
MSWRRKVAAASNTDTCYPKCQLFLVKRVPGRGPEQRESEKTVLYQHIIIIFISNIIIKLLIVGNQPSQNRKQNSNQLVFWFSVKARKPYGRGRLIRVDLLVLTSLDQLLSKLKILFTFVAKQTTLLRRSNVLSLSPSVRIPWSGTSSRNRYLLDIYCSLFQGNIEISMVQTTDSILLELLEPYSQHFIWAPIS